MQSCQRHDPLFLRSPEKRRIAVLEWCPRIPDVFVSEPRLQSFWRCFVDFVHHGEARSRKNHEDSTLLLHFNFPLTVSVSAAKHRTRYNFVHGWRHTTAFCSGIKAIFTGGDA